MYFLHFNTMYKSSQPSNFPGVTFFETFSTDSKSAFFDTHIENICNVEDRIRELCGRKSATF
jgi:hypothetical protein